MNNNPIELKRLADLESVIKAGQESFTEVVDALVKVGDEKLSAFFKVSDALRKVRDEKLFEKKEYKNFESYCSGEWGWSAGYVRRVIRSGDIVRSLPPAIQKSVRNEAVARELSKVPPRRRVEVLVRAQEQTGGNATAKAIKEVFTQLPQRKKPVVKPSGPKDATGLEIPPERLEFWKRNDEAQSLLSSVSRLRGILEKAKEEGDLLFAEVDFVANIGKLSSIYQDLKCAKSFAVCPDCNGILIEGCRTCRGRGFISEFYWDSFVPKEKKELRDLK